jgi:hypothetical protein
MKADRPLWESQVDVQTQIFCLSGTLRLMVTTLSRSAGRGRYPSPPGPGSFRGPWRHAFSILTGPLYLAGLP